MLKASGQLSERETLETEVIKLLISSCTCCVFATHKSLIAADFNITKRTVIDMVPKAIMLNLVTMTKENLQRELLAELYTPDALGELLKESDYVVNRRKECKCIKPV